MDELLKAKAADGMSVRYIGDLENRLGRFAKKFNAERIGELTSNDMGDWLVSLGVGHRGRNNFRAAIGAQRLSWSEVKFEQDHIEVTAGKAKTAQRRLVPIPSNLAAWIRPYTKFSGLVCKLSTINQKASDFAGKLGIAWPHNGLRHSYASYRLAQCKNAAEVAFEMGNSSRVVFQHYREIVTPAEAAKWWLIEPVSHNKIVSIPAA